MEKVVSFLEKHVQWIALGLGVLFLAYMAYSNFVETPEHLTVDVGGKKVPPGEMANAIATSDSFRRLQEGMKREATLELKPIDPVRDVSARLTLQMDPILPTHGGGEPPPPPDVTAAKPVKELPKPPQAMVKGVAVGRSVVMPYPPPPVDPAA